MEIIKTTESLLTALHASPRGEGLLIRNNPNSLPYAIQVLDGDGEGGLYFGPTPDQLLNLIERCSEDGLLEVFHDVIRLTETGRSRVSAS